MLEDVRIYSVEKSHVCLNDSVLVTRENDEYSDCKVNNYEKVFEQDNLLIKNCSVSNRNLFHFI